MTDRCLIEVYTDGAVGDDFGGPGEAPAFAEICAKPLAAPDWRHAVRMWIHLSGCAGDGAGRTWARAYVTADGLRGFIDMTLGPADRVGAWVKAQISDRDRYILFAGEDRRASGSDRPTWSEHQEPHRRRRRDTSDRARTRTRRAAI